MESRRYLKCLRLLLMTFPFLAPWLMGLVEEICGRVMVLNYAMVALFAVSLIALYIWGVVSAIFSKNQAGVAHELFMFHFVKMPLFALAWFIHFIVFLIVVFCINGFDGVQ